MRLTLSLNGPWQLAETAAALASPDQIPADGFSATVAVPGLARFAEPRPVGLRAADQGWSHVDTRRTVWRDPHRDYFWYRRRFDVAPADLAASPVARLRFAKAQFGLRVWLNGHDLGEHLSCFSSATFLATAALRPGENELLVRVGAHPGMLPPEVCTGSDHEKYFWTAGLYDDVALLLSGPAVIESSQVAPRWSEGCFDATWTAHNAGSAPVTCAPFATVGARRVDLPPRQLAPGERATFTARLVPEEPRAWSPDDPHLHPVTLSTGPEGDELALRVGLREFRFDTVTRRAWLNGRIIYLRGTNLCVHRFFEDEACAGHPWDEAWARRLLVELPRRYHWNCMRWSIGPAPERWLDLADEAGLLVEYEFAIWMWRDHWDHALVQTHAAAWMADAWNHPSVAWWSLSNETHHAPLIDMVEALRPLDHSARAWSNGYNLPSGDHDPVDDHPYIIHGANPWFGGPGASPATYEQATAPKANNSPHPSAHAVVINEYCWAWLRRDDSPTDLTAAVYGRQFCGSTPAQRRRFYADLLAAETEYFRAHRNAAGILHFTGLTCDHPWSLTGDHFEDVATLRVRADHDTTFRDCFAPLGVYLNFWRTQLTPDGGLQLDAMLVNDTAARLAGEIEFAVHQADARGHDAPIEALGPLVASARLPFAVASLCQQTVRCLALRVPAEPGAYVVRATAFPPAGDPVTSRRRFQVALPPAFVLGPGN